MSDRELTNHIFIYFPYSFLSHLSSDEISISDRYGERVCMESKKKNCSGRFYFLLQLSELAIRLPRNLFKNS